MVLFATAQGARGLASPELVVAAELLEAVRQPLMTRDSGIEAASQPPLVVARRATSTPYTKPGQMCT